MNGHLSLGYAYYASDDTTYHENITVKDWREIYAKKRNSSKLPDYSGYTYDAVWTFGFALDKLLKENLTHYANLHRDDTNK